MLAAQGFLNFQVDKAMIPKPPKKSKADFDSVEESKEVNASKPEPMEVDEEEAEEQMREANDWRNYVIEFTEYQVPRLKSPPKHRYTIHLHRAVYTEELFEVYKRYELAVHGKERNPSNLVGHLCNSPVYDPA